MKISEMINKTSVAQILWSSDGSTLAPESQSLWSSLTGQIEEAMRPWGWLAAIRPDERERVKQQWEDAVLGPRVFTLQCQLRNTEKGDSMLALLCAPLFNNAGTLDGWVSWMSREREPAFLATTAIPPEMLLSDEIASQAPLGMVCLSLDRSFIRANERYCQIVGYAQEELLGRRLQAILPVDIQMLINLNTRQMLRGDMQHVVYETAYPRPDGQRLWLKVISTLVWHPQGFPLYFFSWVEDLTLQRRGVQERRTLVARQQAAQVAAQRAKEQAFSLGALLQVIFQNATEGVIVYDRDGRMQQINNAARTLLELGPEDECLGKTVMDLFSGYERYNEAMEPIALETLPVSRLLQGQAVSPARIPALHVRFPSGQERYLDLTWTPLHDQAGQAAGLVTIFRDVTSRYQ
jgi:PAS domain S-box-containing protein